MVMGKQGFLRIIEAFIAVLIVTGVLLFLYIGNVPKVDKEDVIYPIIRVSLKEITGNEVLRAAVLDVEYTTGSSSSSSLDTTGSNYQTINNSFSDSIPVDFNYHFNICDIEALCGPDDSISAEIAEKEVFSDNVVIFKSPSATNSDPKKLRLFVWEKGS